MKDIYILIIFSFIIHKSIELEPERNYLNRNLENLEDEMQTDNGNWTESDPSSDIEIGTDPAKEVNYEKPTTKPVLLGFNFIKNTENKVGQLKVFFKNIAKKSIFQKFIFFFIIITKKVRVLEDGKKQLVKGELNETSLLTDNVEYIVKKDDDINKNIIDLFEGKVSAKMEKPNIVFLSNDTNINATEQLLNKIVESDITYISETVLEDITEQEYNPEKTILFYVQNIRKIGSQSYKLTGNFSKPFEIENNKEIITFNYKYISQINTFDATLTKLNDGNYQMSFSIPNYIEIDLNSAWANITERKITIQRRLETNNYYEQLQFKETSPNQLELPLPSPETHSFGGKIGSSSGLSGTAIAFIVIGSVLVLVCVGIAAIYLSRSKPKQNDASAIEFYNSSLSVVQDQ